MRVGSTESREEWCVVVNGREGRMVQEAEERRGKKVGGGELCVSGEERKVGYE